MQWLLNDTGVWLLSFNVRIFLSSQRGRKLKLKYELEEFVGSIHTLPFLTIISYNLCLGWYIQLIHHPKWCWKKKFNVHVHVCHVSVKEMLFHQLLSFKLLTIQGRNTLCLVILWIFSRNYKEWWTYKNHCTLPLQSVTEEEGCIRVSTACWICTLLFTNTSVYWIWKYL